VDNAGNVEDREALDEHPAMVDNPRGRVEAPVALELVHRGQIVEIKGTWVDGSPDPAGNGHDVGQMAFMVKRKAEAGGIDGPWILIDAKDSDLDGEFGEPGDPVDPSDTNMPYSVFWTVPDWLTIDDPETEHIREEEAKYWVVAVAGDGNTGPLNKADGQAYVELVESNEVWTVETPGHEFIHWDNPYRIIKNDSCTGQAHLIRVVDWQPPRTRVLQVGEYVVPSEQKMWVGKTVTVLAGDTEVDWKPPLTFPTPPFETFDGDKKHSFDNVYPPIIYTDSQDWNTDEAKNAAWSIGMLYPSVSLTQPMRDD
jgi:hypothetical protein